MFVFCGWSTTATATLIGDEVRIQVSVVDTTFPVAEGVDPDFSFSSFNWNLESASILFFVGPLTGQLASGVSFTLSDLDWVGEPLAVLTGASIVDATGLFGSATDDILTIDDHSIVVDLSSFAGGSLAGAPSILISLETQVPEPGTLVLVGSGLAGLGLVRRPVAGRGH